MSFVSLKNSILGRAPIGQSKPEKSTTTPNISNASLTSDIESQAPTTSVPIPTKSARHLKARLISDATIGLADGLTVPFALTAGLSALGDVKIVIFGGLAELIAGAISMGLGGYLGAKSEAASYFETRARTQKMLSQQPEREHSDDKDSGNSGNGGGEAGGGGGEKESYAHIAISDIMSPFSLRKDTIDQLVGELKRTPDALLDLILHHEHGCSEPPSSRAVWSALTIALGYFFGGLLPLVPYFCVGTGEGRLLLGLYISIGVMAFALFTFGYIKTCVVSGWRGRGRVGKGVWGGVQMMIVGGGAAGAAWGLVTAFDKFIR